MFVPTSFISVMLSTAPEEVVPTVATGQFKSKQRGVKPLGVKNKITKDERLEPNF